MKKFFSCIKNLLMIPFDKIDEWKERRQNQKELKEKRKKTKFIYK
jgi:hypothetical protein